MVGVIRKRDVLAHPLVTIQCFGWRVFLKTLVARRQQTFLALLMSTDVLASPRAMPADAPALVERSIQLELQAARLYEGLATRFAENEAARRFFQALAQQEHEHAELLRLCRAAAKRGGWESSALEPCERAMPRLERHMEDAESVLEEGCTLADALQLVIQIESSEVNRVFQRVLAAADSEFVKAMGAFNSATRRHFAYICTQLPQIEPALKEKCQIFCDACKGCPELN